MRKPVRFAQWLLREPPLSKTLWVTTTIYVLFSLPNRKQNKSMRM